MTPKQRGGVFAFVIAAAMVGVAAFDRRKKEPAAMPSSDARSLVVEAASAEIGAQDAAKYWAAVLPSGPPYPPSWCGGFALWALKQAGLASDIQWKIGKGFCYQLPITRNPQPGDIAYIDQPYQHHAIVESVDGDSVTTIDGNQRGETVARRTRNRSAITAFYSIEPLLSVAYGV